MADEVMAVIKPSLIRRFMAVALLLISGGLLIYWGFNDATVGVIWKIFLTGAGVGLLVLADKLRRATAESIELTEAGLRESSGRILCAYDNIEKVERSAMSFKPSNGLLVRLNTPLPLAWAPGLWWRYGRKIGIGGVTSARQAKAMADVIALRRLLPQLDLDEK